MAKETPRMTHKKLCSILAGAYYSFLKALLSANPPSASQAAYDGGIRHSDCKGHFLSNAYLTLYDKHFRDADWIYHSKAAGKILDSGSRRGLRFEHIVPKERYIQEEGWRLVETEAPDAQKKIEQLLEKYWFIAIITAAEEKRLSATAMPDGWDGKDIFARYKQPKDGGKPILLYRADGTPCW